MGMPKDLFGRDPGEIERGLDEWVAGFERNAERYRELQRRVDEIRLTATSPSGVVTVTVDATGALIDARFTDRVASTPPDELSRQLMTALGRARAQIVDRVREVADDTLGPQGQASADRIVEHFSDRFSGLGKPDHEVRRSECQFLPPLFNDVEQAGKEALPPSARSSPLPSARRTASTRASPWRSAWVRRSGGAVDRRVGFGQRTQDGAQRCWSGSLGYVGPMLPKCGVRAGK